MKIPEALADGDEQQDDEWHHFLSSDVPDHSSGKKRKMYHSL